MISDNIQRTNLSLKERGIEDSYFSVIFKDGSEITEKETNWSFLSEKKVVNCLGKKKKVSVSKYPIKSIKCFHQGLETEISVGEGCQVYQSIRSETLFIKGVIKNNRIVGRTIGVIKDGKVIEERFLNLIENKVQGFKS